MGNRKAGSSNWSGIMDMNALSQELREAYPNATRAILLVEDDINSQWWKEIKRYATEFGIEAAIQAVNGVIPYSAETFLKLAKEEFLTDDFRRYFMGKLGMM